MAIVMDDFFKVRVDSYGLQNSIIKDLKTLKWLMSCSGTFSLHIGKKPKKGKQSRDGRHFRQTVNQMTGIRDDYLSSEDEEDSKKLVTFASTHQGDSDQPLYHYPGQQCAGIAFISLLYSTILPVASWKKCDLDKMMMVGDRLHFFRVCCLGYSTESTQKLHVDELPIKLIAFNYEFQVERDVFGGNTRHEEEEETESEEGVWTLERVLEKSVQENYPGLVLRIQDYCVSCINSYGEWFMFDSHARDQNGMIDGNGKAVLLKFSNSAALAKHINDFIEANNGTDLSYEALVLIKIQRKSCTTKDETCINFVPSAILTMYRSKYGNVQVDSDNLQNLEQGFLIDDNIVDFVFFYKAEEISAAPYISTDTLYIFSSCFHKKLASFNPNRIRNWTKGVNIFLKEYVIIPVCTGTHWMLVIVKMNRGDGVSIMILDAANRPSLRSNKIHRPSVERLVKNYLRDEWAAKATLKKKSVSFGEVIYPDVPQQPNDTDCGAYVMKFFSEFLNDLPIDNWPRWTPEFTHDEVRQLRTDIQFLLQQLSHKQSKERNPKVTTSP